MNSAENSIKCRLNIYLESEGLCDRLDDLFHFHVLLLKLHAIGVDLLICQEIIHEIDGS